MNEAIFLVGMPGVGKSEVARLIGELLGREVIDLDDEISTASGMSVDEIFELEEEAGYRDRESDALMRAIADSDGHGVVIATGGGVVEREVNRTALYTGGTVVWLDAPLEVLELRLATDTTVRPLLQSPTALAALAAARVQLYAGIADVQIDATGDPADIAAATLLALGMD